jgi:hypothetical protein
MLMASLPDLVLSITDVSNILKGQGLREESFLDTFRCAPFSQLSLLLQMYCPFSIHWT